MFLSTVICNLEISNALAATRLWIEICQLQIYLLSLRRQGIKLQHFEIDGEYRI